MAKTYKYSGFTVGQTIRAYDFEPLEGRPDCYVEGTVLEVNDTSPYGTAGYAHYVIDCAIDSVWWHGVRIGQKILVPMESMMDWDGRITEVPVTTACVCGKFRLAHSHPDCKPVRS